MSTLDVRTRILDAVLHIVITDGIAGVSNRRIAAQAGVSLGSITYHFPAQSDMLRATLFRFVTDETTRLLALAEKYRFAGLSIEDAAAMTESVARDLSFSAERIAPFEMYIAAGRDHELHQVAMECFAAYDNLAVTILTALGVPNPQPVASAMVALIAGIQLRQLATGIDDQDITSSILLILRGASHP
ncbi:TetR/AcrR family transcriptional regulator [Rhodococcus sp. ARC_M6]|uniref:TetR/AcrR family transcriptional regulator n=1 Tax=Rhodococcus sp. ARC_M6 TaxID=2928852 RepID=UPI001FB52A47|nr:TetR/AcrR family transcriptional regulator [Rhodococcus sp. ARC_M6]MCJ0903294.1 TetR family transcriptional regulator [Rhodococcus sp. ARC_M6]